MKDQIHEPVFFGYMPSDINKKNLRAMSHKKLVTFALSLKDILFSLEKTAFLLPVYQAALEQIIALKDQPRAMGAEQIESDAKLFNKAVTLAETAIKLKKEKE
jgi:hypothetical protein